VLDKAHDWFRDWFRKVWNIRGGGLYACGYALTFIYLEVTTIFGEIAESESIGNFFSEQLVEFFFRFAGDSISNLIKALMWPVYIVQWQSPFGAIALGAAFFAFPKYLKKPITSWLFDDTEEKPSERCL
jgi:hypothetical protein